VVVGGSDAPRERERERERERGHEVEGERRLQHMDHKRRRMAKSWH
jgi:hypothetical protein